MGAHPLIFAAVLLFSVQLGYSVPPTITFTPPSPLILTSNETQPGTGRPLAITCSQGEGGTLNSLNLFKLNSAGLKTPLMNAVNIPPPDGTNGIAQNALGITGPTASGSISQKSITLTYSQASCDSGGTYICASSIYVQGTPSTSEISSNYSVDVNPGRVSLIIDGAPSGSTFMVGDSATLRCHADVGTVKVNTTVDFVWQFEVQNIFGGKTFQDYPKPGDINSTASPTYNQYCNKSQNRISLLIRNLTIEDSERQYKCYIRKGNQSYENVAGFLTFPLVQDAGTSPINRSTFVGVNTALAVVLLLVVVNNVAFVI